jgi:hypothetical protein
VGRAKQPWPVKLVMPLLSGDPSLLDRAARELPDRFGPVDLISERLPFSHTAYYAAEFGTGLLRMFLSFERLIDPGALADIKVWTNGLEEAWAEADRRRINLDPGYISLAKLVLATTKNHGHRIYLRGGIYAEVTLVYRDGAFQRFPWTYPDYASAQYLAILERIRAIYKDQTLEVRRAASITPR